MGQTNYVPKCASSSHFWKMRKNVLSEEWLMIKDRIMREREARQEVVQLIAVAGSMFELWCKVQVSNSPLTLS